METLEIVMASQQSPTLTACLMSSPHQVRSSTSLFRIRPLDSEADKAGMIPTNCPNRSHFLFGGGAGFGATVFASFFGFFFSLPWELLPLPMCVPRLSWKIGRVTVRGVGFAPTA